MNNLENHSNELPIDSIDKEIIKLNNANVVSMKGKRKERKLTNIQDFSIFKEVYNVLNNTDEENKKSTSSDTDARKEKDILKSESNIKYSGNFIYYINTEKQDGKFVEVKHRLSNFLITPLYTINTDEDNTKYYMKIQNNKTTKTFIIDGETLSNNRLFKSFCRSKGDFNWLGNQNHLDRLNDYLISTFDYPEVKESNYMGFQIDLESYNPDNPEKMEDNVWLFPTHGYYNGELIYPDDDGVFHTPNKNYLLNRKKFPLFNMNVAPIEKTPSNEEVLNLFANLQTLYNEYNWLGIGYMTATLQVSTIAKHTNQFPYFYPVGVLHTGKTDYLNFMYKFAGLNADLVNPPEKLDVFRKDIGNYSHLPFGYDEAQDENKNNFKTTSLFQSRKNELKTLFNRKPTKRGDKDPNKIHSFPIRCGLTFSGEVPTSESAIQSRMVFVTSTKFYHDIEIFDEVASSEDVMYWIGQFMIRTSHEWRAEFVEYYFDFIEKMTKNELYKPILTRVKKSYATLLAGAKVFMKQIDRRFNTQLYTPAYMDSLLSFSLEEMLESQVVVAEGQNCLTFLSQVAHLANKGALRKDVHYKVDVDSSGNAKTLYLSHREAWSAIQDARIPTSYNATNQITRELEQFSYFEKPKQKNRDQKKISGKNYRVWQFDLQDRQLPEFFQHFIQPQYLVDLEGQESSFN